MKVIFDDTQTADDLVTIQTKKPTQFRFPFQISLHALQISLLGDAPLAMEPLRGHIHKFRVFS